MWPTVCRKSDSEKNITRKRSLTGCYSRKSLLRGLRASAMFLKSGCRSLKSGCRSMSTKSMNKSPKKLKSTPPPKKGRLTIECDEMWSYVGNKTNKSWIWLAIHVSDSTIVGAFIGERSSARGLWNSLPQEYQKCALCYTHFWEAYALIFPKERHLAVGKKTGRTNQIEGFNCFWRQRVARLVRKTLSFSKKLANHIGAIWPFIHYHNQSLHV